MPVPLSMLSKETSTSNQPACIQRNGPGKFRLKKTMMGCDLRLEILEIHLDCTKRKLAKFSHTGVLMDISSKEV